MRALYGHFAKVSHTPVFVTELRHGGPRAESTIYIETMTKFWLAGEPRTSEPISVPRVFRFEIGKAEVWADTRGFRFGRQMFGGILVFWQTESKKRAAGKDSGASDSGCMPLTG